MKKINLLAMVLCAISLSIISCKKEKATEEDVHDHAAHTGTLEIVFTPMVGNEGLYFDSAYTNPAGEEFELDVLRFYLSNIGLSKADGTEESVEGYNTRLVNFNTPNFDAGYGNQSVKLTMTADAGSYSDIRFDVGVPSEVNHKDATTNPYPLDLSVDGMYWNWNSGYVFLLAEGKGKDVPGDYFHFGIGTDMRMMSFFFGNMLVSTPKFEITAGKTTRLYFTLDFNKVLTNTNNTNYSFGGNDYAPSNVHGGYYADVLKSNIQQAFALVKTENIN